MKVAVIGSRNIKVDDLGLYLPEGVTEIISGGAKGVDSCAREYAVAHNIKLTEFLPDYRRYGRGAPLKRNYSIIENAKKDTSQNASYGRDHHYNDSRYHMLNYHATFTKGTIEFRLFQFDAPADGKRNGLHAGQLKSYIQLCLALSQMAKDRHLCY